MIPFDPLVSVWSTVSRETKAAGVLGPEQAATRREALQMYTVNPAFLTFEETTKGSIEAGKLADLVVLSDDPMHCPEPEIRDIRPLATVLGGKVVHGHLQDL